MAREVAGVGLQVNPTIVQQIGLEGLGDMPMDFAELLCDSVAGPLDSSYVLDPSYRWMLDEVGFIAEIIRKAGTYSLLDLHNIYANSVNFEGYDPWHFVRTLPLDRVIEIHLAGGQTFDGFYHDLHNNAAPDPVWEMLDW